MPVRLICKVDGKSSEKWSAVSKSAQIDHVANFLNVSGKGNPCSSLPPLSLFPLKMGDYP